MVSQQAGFQHCGDEAALVGYLYDECESEERAAVAAHLAVCATCTEDLAGLRATRVELAGWIPPEVQLGFRVVQNVAAKPANVLRPGPWWRQPMPAWAQVAAAVLIFTAGGALGALRGTQGAPASLAVSSGSTATATAVSASDLAALEQRLRAQLTQVQLAAAHAPADAPVAVGAGGVTLEQVRGLIQESEQRQQRETTLRTAEVMRDIDAQRRGDLARIERTFGQMEGNTGVQVQQQQQMLNYLMRVSQRP